MIGLRIFGLRRLDTNTIFSKPVISQTLFNNYVRIGGRRDFLGVYKMIKDASNKIDKY